MKRRRVPILLSLLVCMFANAAETTRPPSAPVSEQPPVADAPPKSDTTPPAADSAKPAPSNPVAESKAKNPDGDFKPSEEISEDMAVAYPVDI
jgi:hypothetical protein